MSDQTPNLAPKSETQDMGTTFERIDNRWDFQHARRDWLIILVLVIIYLLWTGMLFLFEPGIR